MGSPEPIYYISVSHSRIDTYLHIHISIYVENKAGVWPGRPECIYLSIWTRATTAASAADSASSTETSGLGLLRPTEAEASVLEAE